MWSADDFQYAMENTEVLKAPDHRIATFGQTSFRFFLITELMDSSSEIRVRDGKIEAERPQIIAPGNYSRLLLEGFGEQARQFAEWLRHRAADTAILKYGFQFRKTDVRENVMRAPLAQVVDNVRASVRASDDPLSAIIRGVDDAWEVCLLKFTVDLVQRSARDNLGEFRRRGMV